MLGSTPLRMIDRLMSVPDGLSITAYCSSGSTSIISRYRLVIGVPLTLEVN